MSLSISTNGLALIKKFEGCKLTAYKPVSTEKYWTIGYGHYGADVKQGQTITQAQADAFLKADCANAERVVNNYNNTYHWNQNQFDALVSFTFNCGGGNLKNLLRGGQCTIAEISAGITAYNKANGKILRGLINRRAAEKALFDKPAISPVPVPDPAHIVRPVSYLQTDIRWKNHNYSAKGESKTIGSAGCGVTVAAMVIAALKDKNVTPVTTAEWSMAHGYKAFNQGTYYTYFVPQLSEYGIACKMLNQSNLYGTPASAAHTEALNSLKNGNWVIACMGKGNWTNSGHFILLYQYENGFVYINDPASVSVTRIKNTWSLFAAQVKYLWTVSVSGEPVTPIPPTPDTPSETAIELLGKINTGSGNLNIRSAPDPSSAKTGSYKKGELVPLTAMTSTNWYRTDRGYIFGEYVVAARGKVSHCAKLHLRKEPNPGADNVVSILSANDEVYLIGQADNGWYKVKTKDHSAGYVSDKYITII